MIIDKKLLDKWKVLRSSRDTTELVENNPGSYPAKFSRVFKDGRCSDKVFRIMAEFYEKKGKLVKEYL